MKTCFHRVLAGSACIDIQDRNPPGRPLRRNRVQLLQLQPALATA